MAPSRSLIRSIVLGLAGVLLEFLLFLPSSPAGLYLETKFGVSNVILIQAILGLLGLVLLGYSIYAIAVAVVGWRRTFHAELVGKDRFLLGETVHFKAWFKGELKNGLFTCKVQLPDGTQEWWPAYDTFQRSENGDLGVLSGRKVHEAEWSVLIAKEYPIGQYAVRIGVWDRVDLGSKNTPVKEKQASFWVLAPGYQGSMGTTAVASGDAGFVIERGMKQVYTCEQLVAELPFDKLLPRAKQAIIFVGASLEHLATKKDLLTRLISENSKLTVTCVLLNPGNKELIERLEKDKAWAGLKEATQGAIERLCGLKADLGAKGKRLKIMTYDVEPPFTMVVLDPLTEAGHMEFGNYIRGVDPSARMMSVFEKKGMETLFKKYWDEYEAFCKSKGKECRCPTG